VTEIPGEDKVLVEKRLTTHAIKDYTSDNTTAMARGPTNTSVYNLKDSPQIVSR